MDETIVQPVPVEATPSEPTPAPETIALADYKKLEESYKGLQRKSSAKDREIQELRTRSVTPEHLKALEDKVFSALEVIAPKDEDEETRPVSRQERLRQLREVKPQAPVPQIDAETAAVARQALRLMKKLGIEQGSAEYNEIIEDNHPLDIIEKLETRWESEVAKRALETKKLDEAKAQKSTGVTKPDGGPSAASIDEAAFIEGFNAGRLNSPADHKRAREILAKLK